MTRDILLSFIKPYYLSSTKKHERNNMDVEEPRDEGQPGGSVEQSPEQLVARAIAPVKKDFLRPPPVRSSSPNDGVSIPNDNNKTSVLAKEKKSKRQLKRERRLVPSFTCLCLSTLQLHLTLFAFNSNILRNKSQHETCVPKLPKQGMLVHVLIKTSVVSAMIWKPSRHRCVLFNCFYFLRFACL